jgi:SAM-dependent methyltransferase
VTVIADPDRPSGRTLLLDTARHSYVDLQDPTHLEFRYLRIVAAVIEAVPGQQATRSANGPLDALHIGGGAFTLPHYLAAERPGTTSMVLEIDGELVDIVEARLGLEISEQLQVQVGDARLAIRDIEPDSYDVVVGDAFSGMTVPWHLTTREMAADIRDVLRPDGVYVLNLIDGFDNKFGRSQVATLQEIFEFVEVIVPPDNRIDRASVNQVLVASTAPIPQYDVAPNDGVLLSGPAIIDFVAGARSLTDDWAPVDQLRTR